jgi:predicted transcriptional regulator
MSASNPIELASEIVAAFVSNNPLPKGELPSLILAVHTAVIRLAAEPESVPQIEVKTPAVPIRRSITPDFLICLDDGKRFKSLRRHLSGHGMTPEQYREKWNLPSDYPMVAPNYAAQRSALAKQIGLGQIRGKAGVRKSAGHSKAGQDLTSCPPSFVENVVPKTRLTPTIAISPPQGRRGKVIYGKNTGLLARV